MRGFTLMELLVVLAIVGLLSSVALTSLVNARTEARDSKRLIEIADVSRALSRYAEDHASYPATLETLVSQAYLSVVPEDPRLGVPFVYKVTRDGSRYYLGVNLESRSAAALLSDSDSVRTGIYGSDSSGCSREFRYHCYDVSRVIQ
ncbi:MAG: type II secretion system protein [Patescibacteria group bacterium UBA2103]